MALHRSFLHVDGIQVVNNDGLHGDREICGRIQLAAGEHVVVVSASIRTCMLALMYMYPFIQTKTTACDPVAR